MRRARRLAGRPRATGRAEWTGRYPGRAPRDGSDCVADTSLSMEEPHLRPCGGAGGVLTPRLHGSQLRAAAALSRCSMCHTCSPSKVSLIRISRISSHCVSWRRSSSARFAASATAAFASFFCLSICARERTQRQAGAPRPPGAVGGPAPAGFCTRRRRWRPRLNRQGTPRGSWPLGRPRPPRSEE